MTRTGGSLTVLLDEGTPILAGGPFSARGHHVINHRDVCEPGASDQIVAAMACLNHAVLIAVDLDMKRFARRFGAPNDGEKFASLHLIQIGCGEVLAAKRLQHALSFIEHEWEIVCQKVARRLWIDIGAHRLTSYR